jgi:hypothetical protein
MARRSLLAELSISFLTDRLHSSPVREFPPADPSIFLGEHPVGML